MDGFPVPLPRARIEDDRDRTHRYEVNARVMADPCMAEPPANDMFDGKRMIWGGFAPFVTKGIA